MEDNNFDVFSATISEDNQFQTGDYGQFDQNDNSYVSKKASPKKLLITAGAIIAVVVLVIVLMNVLGNSYKTPIKEAEKLLNSKSLSKIIDRAPSLLNGFGESEAKKALKILKKSDEYKDGIEEAEEAFDEAIENLEDEWGKNYKIKLKVEDKDKLSSKECKAFRENLRSIGEMVEEIEDLDSDDYEDIADEMGLSKSQVKKLIKLLEKFGKKCKSAKVTAGYELDVLVKVTGKELDDPIEENIKINVFKVGGRWVPDVFSLVQMIGYGGAMSLMGGF